MKKIIAAAAGLMLVGSAMVTTASAVENKFGGYWRTRMMTFIDFDGMDSGTESWVDTRTRLYYTAIFNENFKFVNKFEMDAVWGGEKAGYGDVGADGIKVEVKNSYADFNVGATNWKVGVQPFTVSRGLMIDTDAAGIIAAIPAGAVTLPFVWMRVSEEEFDRVKPLKAPDGTTLYPGVSQPERDHFGVLPVIPLGENASIQPMFIYDTIEGANWDNFYIGANFDVKMDAATIWGTGVYQFGTAGTLQTFINGQLVSEQDVDLSSWLLAVGASAGPVHGQIFYASGDDNGPWDAEIESFVGPAGQSYYWAEIMGYGTFDANLSNGSPGDAISNIWAANVGFKVKPMDKLTLAADVWYAELAEGVGDTDLGFEFDVKATYAIYDNLKLDLVAAYLVAGDATGDEDPIELGARLSLSF